MAAHPKVWYLQRFRMLDAMTPPQMHLVEKMTRMLEVKRGQRIYMQGDPSDQIFLLKVGVVRISTHGPEQQETILAFLYPGDLFGELAIVDDSPRDHLATAHEDVVLCTLGRDLLLRMAQETPALGYQITKVMGLRLRRFRTRIEELLCKSAQARPRRGGPTQHPDQRSRSLAWRCVMTGHGHTRTPAAATPREMAGTRSIGAGRLYRARAS